MTKRTCSIDGCTRPVLARGWCGLHYGRIYKTGDPGSVDSLRRPERGCSVEGCTDPHSARGWCGGHYQRWRRHGDPDVLLKVQRDGCLVADCDAPHGSHGLCATHSQLRWKYDLSTEDVVALISRRHCDICRGDAAHIDHCHDCGTVRGRLCHNCNTCIGIADDPDRLEAKAAWLRAACDCHVPSMT